MRKLCRAAAVVTVLLALGLAVLGCGPSPGGDASPNRGATAGMCPNCGSTDLDVQSQTERSAYDGTETEILVMTCRGCGHSWRAPAAVK
jgi:hypothetical protein